MIDAFVEEAAFYLVCLTVALLPVSFWPLVFRGFSLPKVIVGYLLIAAALALLTARLWLFKAKVSQNSTRLLLAAFCLFLIPTAFLSISPATAFLGSYRQLNGLLSWAAMAAFALVVSTITWDESRLHDLLIVIAGTTAIVSAAAWAQYFWPPVNQLWHIQIYQRSVFAFFGNAGYLAAFLAFALPVVMALALEAKGRVARVAYGVIWLAAIGALGFSGSRGGWVAAAVSLALGAAAIRGSGLKFSARRAAILLALGLAVFAVTLSLIGSSGGKAGAARLSGDTATLTARVGYWRAATVAAAERPLTGAGPDTFGIVYPKLSSRQSQRLEPETVTDDAHNVFLQMAATLGVLPLVLFLALVANAFILFRAAKPDREGLMLWGLAIGTAGYLLAVQTNVNSWGTSFIPWLFIGIMGSLAGKADSGAAENGRARLPYLMAPVLLALVVTGLFNLQGLWKADGLFLKGEAAPVLEAPAFYRQAAQLWPTNESYWLSLAKSLAARNPRAAEAAAKQARRNSPLSYLPDQFLAQFYLADGARLPHSRILAGRAAARALERFPNSPKLNRIFQELTRG